LRGVEQRNPQAWAKFLEYAQINAFLARDVLSDSDLSPMLMLRDLGSAGFGEFSIDHPDQIELAIDIAQQFEEDSPNDPRIAPLVEAKLLHELVHWGDFLSGSMHTGIGLSEWGLQFENAAYGRVQDRYWTRPNINEVLAGVQSVGGVGFAQPNENAQYWPVRTTHSRGRQVAYMTSSGAILGAKDRMFMAPRQNGARYHAGVDLWANAGDPIIACEGGKVVDYYLFDDGTYALLVQCESGLVINYGEVQFNSWNEFGAVKGSRVRAGQAIARVGKHTSSGSAMCHFETYREGTSRNQKWLTSAAGPPNALLNPTQYLLKVAHGL
jgi:murein DD-endopeptidase MepM/ murein hydrolase activator NlpD